MLVLPSEPVISMSLLIFVVAATLPIFTTAQTLTANVAPPPIAVLQIQEIFTLVEAPLEEEVFVYEAAEAVWLPSDTYTLAGFAKGLQVMYETGFGTGSDRRFFYLGDGSANSYKYGVANIAAFLSQVMKESLRYNACDENSWDLVNGVYPISNSCGQLLQSYQDYKCPVGQEHMECPVDPEMTLTATTNANWYGAPAPLYCGPSSLYPTTGYWDYAFECNQPDANPPQSCTVYEGQKAGREMTDVVTANRAGRTDVEGCCWWGRGAIQTTGPCNYGRLNYFLGKKAADDGRPSRYPTVDICADPGLICSSEEYPELKWIAGLFYWVDSLQDYSSGGWDYLTELHRFVDEGMQPDDPFIDSVSGIVNRGCHNPPCASGSVDGGPERRLYFERVLRILDVEPTIQAPTPSPIEATVPLPTSSPVSPPASVPTSPPVTAPTAAPVPVTASPVTTSSPIISPTDKAVAGSSETDSPSVATTTASQTPTTQPTVQPTNAETTAPTSKMCCAPGETSQKAIAGCQSFYFCFEGELVKSTSTACGDGLLFDRSIAACNHAKKVEEIGCNADPCDGNSTEWYLEFGSVDVSKISAANNGPFGVSIESLVVLVGLIAAVFVRHVA